MGLYRVPGSKDYWADDSGLKELANSSGVQKAVLSAAQNIATNATSVGHSTYEASPERVRGGWANDERAGAVVREVSHDARDSLRKTLLRVTAAMNPGRRA